jgi:hypothetical protein
MILEALKAKKKHVRKYLCVQAQWSICANAFKFFCIFMKMMMDIESSFIVCHDNLLLVLETHPTLNALQGLTFGFTI